MAATHAVAKSGYLTKQGAPTPLQAFAARAASAVHAACHRLPPRPPPPAAWRRAESRRHPGWDGPSLAARTRRPMRTCADDGARALRRLPGRGLARGRAGHIFKNWKERYFVLDNHLLKYYKGSGGGGGGEGRDAPPEKLGELKGVISLQNCTVSEVAPGDADGRPFTFKITPQNRKIYLINAGDEAGRDAWMAAVRNNGQLAPGSARVDSGGPSGSALTIDEEPDGAEVCNAVVGDDSKVTLADFELLKVIGRGTYGKVMQVRRRDTGEVYAMKVLKKETVFARNDPKDLQHTIAERNVLALINTAEHPFILGLKFAFHTPAKLCARAQRATSPTTAVHRARACVLPAATDDARRRRR